MPYINAGDMLKLSTHAFFNPGSFRYHILVSKNKILSVYENNASRESFIASHSRTASMGA